MGNIILLYSDVCRQTSCTTTFSLAQYDVLAEIPSSFFPVQTAYTNSTTIARHNKQQIILSRASPITGNPDLTTDIQHLPLWKTHILQHFHMNDTTDFCDSLLQVDKKFDLVSDGGLREGQGSFGVAFGTFSTDMAMIEGLAPGNSMLIISLTSEAYRLLSGLVFLNMYVKTCNITISANGQINLLKNFYNRAIIHAYTYRQKLMFWFRFSMNCLLLLV
jgi:hypothetical protein